MCVPVSKVRKRVVRAQESPPSTCKPIGRTAVVTAQQQLISFVQLPACLGAVLLDASHMGKLQDSVAVDPT